MTQRRMMFLADKHPHAAIPGPEKSSAVGPPASGAAGDPRRTFLRSVVAA